MYKHTIHRACVAKAAEHIFDDTLVVLRITKACYGGRIKLSPISNRVLFLSKAQYSQSIAEQQQHRKCGNILRLCSSPSIDITHHTTLSDRSRAVKMQRYKGRTGLGHSGGHFVLRRIDVTRAPPKRRSQRFQRLDQHLAPSMVCSKRGHVRIDAMY